MKLRTKFILFILVIHSVTIVLSFFVFRENKWLFLAAEVFVLLSLLTAWSLYRELISPLQLLLTGIDAIRDRDFNIKFVKTGRYEMDKLIGVYNHMIDQLRTERTLQQEQHFFLEKLVQTSPTGIIILDFDDRVDTINPRAMEWMGGRPQHGHPLWQAILELEAGRSRTFKGPGGRTFKVQKARFVDRGFPRAFVMIEELTAEILEAEKRSYGKVIRMMAHEVNNSIGAVNSILDTTLQLHSGPPEIGEALQVAIERNEHLNQFMRNFADIIRLPEPRPAFFDLHELLRKVAQLMEYKARDHGITFGWSLAGEAFQIQADRSQLEQVLINLVKNALEAGHDGGFIRFETHLRPRRLIIADNGVGIPPELEAKLFTPFFSSKNGGQGIGLTLAREILTAHGFPFSLKTDKDGITRFEILV